FDVAIGPILYNSAEGSSWPPERQTSSQLDPDLAFYWTESDPDVKYYWETSPEAEAYLKSFPDVEAYVKTLSEEEREYLTFLASDRTYTMTEEKYIDWLTNKPELEPDLETGG